VDRSPDDLGPTTPGRTPQPLPDVPPTLPSRTAFLLAFVGIVAAGLFGAVIGYGLGDLGGGGIAPLVWAVVGALLGAGGVGIVAVLVLRAQAEWRPVPPGTAPPPVLPVDVDTPDPPDPPDTPDAPDTPDPPDPPDDPGTPT